MIKKTFNNKGFTLIELLVAMTILSIITGMAIPLLRNVAESGKTKRYETYKDSLIYSAKIFVDSYGEDLFGDKANGCAYIDLQDMVERKIAKDIEMENTTCVTSGTYVRVVKTKKEYSYYPYISCGTKNSDGSVEENGYHFPEGEHIKDDDVCSYDSTLRMAIMPSESTNTHVVRSKMVQIHIESFTGISTNNSIYYSYVYTNNPAEVSDGSILAPWQKVNFSLPSNSDQRLIIAQQGISVTATSQKLYSPTDLNGQIYLVLKIDSLKDIYGENWVDRNDKYVIFGPYFVDNTPPTITHMEVIKKDGKWNFKDVRLYETGIQSVNYWACTHLGGDDRCYSDDEYLYNPISNTVDIPDVYVRSKNEGFAKLCMYVKDKPGNISEKACSTKTTYEVKMMTSGAQDSSYRTASVEYTEPQVKTFAETGILSTSPNARDGYRWTGKWAYDAAGTNIVNASDVFVGEDYDKLYAVWNIDSFNLKLINKDAKGGYGSMTVDVVNDYYLPNLTANGFTFLGWSNPSWGAELKKGNNAKVIKSSSNTDYRANWSSNRYTIKLKGLENGTQTQNYNTSSGTISIPNPTWSGHTFTGWSGDGLTGSNNKNLVLPAYTYGDKTYTAHWS